MVRDSFILDENIRVDITIRVTESLIDIEVKIKNESDARVMLNNYYFRRNRYFHFIDENEMKGRVIPLMQTEYDWNIIPSAIDIIEPRGENIYRTRLNWKREDYAFGEYNAFIIYDDEGFIVFSDPTQVNIMLRYGVSPNEMRNMNEINSDAVNVPRFFRSYVIMEF